MKALAVNGIAPGKRNGSTGARCTDLDEIYSIFSEPMNTRIIAIDTSNTSSHGIGYQNALWVSPTKLSIHVDKSKLTPNSRIVLPLGYQDSQRRFPLKSKLGVEFPVTPWSFSCTP